MLKKDRDAIFSHKSDEWATPQWLFDKLNKTFNFTLDPASDGVNNKCSNHYTINEDGLSKDWTGQIVFINPPYSKTYDWVKKAYNEAANNSVVSLMLLPSRTDTKWFHEFCLDGKMAKEICFIKGRLKFGNEKNSAPFPSMIIIFGPENINIGCKITKMSNKP
jgi:site-specific DNA-methyltransferase (adenine-specific)